MLLNEMISNVQSKEFQGILYAKHLHLVIPSLGHPSKTSLRKAAHTLLLNALKTYPNFNQLIGLYIDSGFLSESELVQQKSINSFQSIFILESRQFDWHDS